MQDLDRRKTCAVVAGLRLLQGILTAIPNDFGGIDMPPEYINHAIHSWNDGGTINPLYYDELEELIMEINYG